MPAPDDADVPLDLRFRFLVARVDEMSRELRAIRRDVDHVIRADDIAQAVADEMDDRREKANRNVSGRWMKAGIIGLFVAGTTSIIQLVFQVTG